MSGVIDHAHGVSDVSSLAPEMRAILAAAEPLALNAEQRAVVDQIEQTLENITAAKTAEQQLSNPPLWVLDGGKQAEPDWGSDGVASITLSGVDHQVIKAESGEILVGQRDETTGRFKVFDTQGHVREVYVRGESDAWRPMGLRLNKAPSTLSASEREGVKWTTAGETWGSVNLGGKSFDVVKTGDGQVIIGKQKGNSVFEAQDREGKYLGTYVWGEDGLYRQGRLPGGGLGDGLAGGGDSVPGTPTKAGKENISDKNTGSGLSNEQIKLISGNMATGEATIDIEGTSYNVIKIGEDIFFGTKENDTIALKELTNNEVTNLGCDYLKIDNFLVELKDGLLVGDHIEKFNNFNKLFPDLNCSLNEFLEINMPPGRGDKILRAARGGDDKIYFLMDGTTDQAEKADAYEGVLGIQHILYGKRKTSSTGHVKEFIYIFGEKWFPELKLSTPPKNPTEGFWKEVKDKLNGEKSKLSEATKWEEAYEKFEETKNWYNILRVIDNPSLSKILDNNIKNFRSKFTEKLWEDIVIPDISKRKIVDPNIQNTPQSNQDQTEPPITIGFKQGTLITAYINEYSEIAQKAADPNFSPLKPWTPVVRKKHQPEVKKLSTLLEEVALQEVNNRDPDKLKAERKPQKAMDEFGEDWRKAYEDASNFFKKVLSGNQEAKKYGILKITERRGKEKTYEVYSNIDEKFKLLIPLDPKAVPTYCLSSVFQQRMKTDRNFSFNESKVHRTLFPARATVSTVS
jgi:hypothetical protein